MSPAWQFLSASPAYGPNYTVKILTIDRKKTDMTGKKNSFDNPFQSVNSINFIDIGCSGTLDNKWKELYPLFNLTGFDPNAKDCQRLRNEPHPYKTARYLPFAIAGEKGVKTLYMTKSIYCYSLLQPNYKWLNRFSYADLFREVGTDTVICTTLNALANDQGLKADIIKLDTQGLELPILKAGDKLLENSFCVETETGFMENYKAETTFSQIDQFMRSKGFYMFDINIHSIGRKNILSQHGKHQPLWCNAVWLYDIVGHKEPVTEEQALKVLLICKVLKFFDYGMELVDHFDKLKVLDNHQLAYLKKTDNWIEKKKSTLSKAGWLLSLLPKKVNIELMRGLKEII